MPTETLLTPALAQIYMVAKIVIASGIFSFVVYFIALKFFSKTNTRKVAKKRAYACMQLSSVLSIAALAYIFMIP